ncbi:MAG: hypothetical protein H7Y11_08480, partial [Armatimonadetes bacterium]|nr:hypothetical protein [Anaerolineae bacterium]
GGFELLGSDGKPNLTPWTVANASSDQGKCNKDGKPPVANTGNCAYRSKGSEGENSKLTQVVDLTGLTPAVGDTLTLNASVTVPATPLAKVKLRVKYSDGTPTTKVTLELVENAAYTLITGEAVIASAAVSKIKVSIDNKSLSGKLLVDDVSVIHTTAGTRLLPLPRLGGQQ